jgi:c-di-GMP-binding flagellar brake protein YcgR
MATVPKMPSANSSRWQQPRANKRAYHDGQYEVEINSCCHQTPFKTRLLDFSPNGLGVFSSEALCFYRGQLIRLQIPYLDDDLWQYAVVRHSSGTRHGFEFVKSPDQACATNALEGRCQFFYKKFS